MSSQFTQNVKSGLFWIGIFKVIGQAFVWVNTILIARFLAPADYGLVGMASLITGFILLIGNVGFGSSIVQKKELHDVHVHSLFWITVSIGVGFLLLLYVTAPFAAAFFASPELCQLLRLSAIALFFSIISDIPTSRLLKNLQYKFTGTIDFASNFLASVSVLTFAMFGFGPYGLVFGSIITGFLKFSLACVFGRWMPRLRFEKQDLHGFFKFGGAIVVDRMLWYLYSNADYMILAKKLGKVIFGLYSFAFELACVPTNKLQPILYPVLFSAFSKIQDDLPQMRAYYLKVINIGFLVYAMIYCGMFWVSPDFVRIFLGTKWEPIIPVLLLLVLMQPLRAIGSLSSAIVHAMGRPDIGATNMAIFVVIMIPSFYVGSHWGMIGVALSWCLIYPIAFVITLARILRPTQIAFKDYISQLFSGLRLIGVVSVVIFLVKTALAQLSIESTLLMAWLRFAGIITSGALANLLVLWFLEKNFFTMLKTFLTK